MLNLIESTEHYLATLAQMRTAAAAEARTQHIRDCIVDAVRKLSLAWTLPGLVWTGRPESSEAAGDKGRTVCENTTLDAARVSCSCGGELTGFLRGRDVTDALHGHHHEPDDHSCTERSGTVASRH